MRCKVCILLLFGFMLPRLNTLGCIWDAETMIQERLEHPDMAKLILGEPPSPPDPAPLRKRIHDLTASPQTNDPVWWNNLAGAHLRLGEAREAVALLETVTNKFPDDYGIHANLGTAYHLLGRYQDAEREIGRDLEINPDAHFGVEKYHLALLQYLVRDAQYQKDHVYADEWSYVFVTSPQLRYVRPDSLLDIAMTNEPERDVLEYAETNGTSSNSKDSAMVWLRRFVAETPPPYRYKWDLAADPKFRDGVMYMATMNPKEPACFVMLGIACVKAREYNLAVAAFKRAIQLGSPQADILQSKNADLEEYITKSHQNMWPFDGLMALGAAVIVLYIVLKIRDRKRKKSAEPQAG
jgi:Tetratricopeptide repeat